MNRDARQILTEWLVLQAQAGDEQAFADLYALWAKDLCRLAAVQVGCRGHAEEVAQDAWVSIARSLRRLQDPACFPRWAFRILDRRCADWMRRRQLDRTRTEALPPEDKLPPAETPVAESDDAVALREAIARLDPAARKLLHLFYELGLSLAEIAEVLDVPAGTIKSRLFNVRESLKQQIERMKS
jgi:RNA polymerase sigma-70 factor (ECF subfamily)